MMSKAAFMMQDHLRRNYVMITDITNPNTFIVRGRLPFPQGLTAIAVLFRNKRPADVYAHPYFIEKQGDPSQPSPQLHLTEESQGIMKILSGLRYMRDDNVKLDNTMVCVTDYKVPVEGRMPRVPAEAAEPQVGPHIATRSDNHAAAAQDEQEKKSHRSSLSLEQRAMRRRSVHHVQQLPGGGGDNGLGFGGGVRNPVSRGAAGGGGGGTSSSAASAAAPSDDPAVLPGYSPFPTPEECAADAWVVYRFLKASVFGRRALANEEEMSPAHRLHAPSLFEHRHGGYTVLYNPIEVNEKTFVELLLKLHREERVVKAIVVPTRPAWRQLQVWADVFPDAELICSGEVPLVESRGGVPNPTPPPPRSATSSTRVGAGSEVPADLHGSSTAHVSGYAAEAGVWRGGCQDLGDGLTGLSFPEVDLEAEAAAERRRTAAATARARATAEAVRLEREEERQQQQRYQQSPRHAPPTAADVSEEEHAHHGEANAAADPLATQRRRQEEKMRLRRELAAEEAEEAEKARRRSLPAASPSTPSLSRSPSASAAAAAEEEDAADEDDERDLVDVLWRDVSFFTEKAQQPVGLRRSDLDRLRVLVPRSATATTTASPVERVELTPTIELLRIAGDAVAEEYVLYDANSGALACTDLYHGAYADLDPANSWMCRVWFKFMKRGNYKRADIAPRYKWLQVLRQRSLPALQAAIEELTRTRPIRFLLFAHGTPPLQGEGANLLRQQWSLPPLHPAEMPGDRRGRR